MAYYPGPAPADPNDLSRYVRAELEKIAAELREFKSLSLKVLHVAPDKPRDGMVIAADGSDLNPGSGAGVYEYRAGAWHYLG